MELIGTTFTERPVLRVVAAIGAGWVVWRVVRWATAPRLSAFEQHVAHVREKYAFMVGQVEEDYFHSALQLQVRPGMTILDVGAHYGLFAMSCYLRANQQCVSLRLYISLTYFSVCALLVQGIPLVSL